jgi:hypothetical protein
LARSLIAEMSSFLAIETKNSMNSKQKPVAKFHPLGRMAEISDVVDAVLYLQNAS